jgi:hypothetical protein
VNRVMVGMIFCSIQVSDSDDKGISKIESREEPREIKSQND